MLATNSNIKFSIVTVVYNGAAFIEETIQSVIHQNYSNYEYIIIDGASTDNTLDIVKVYRNNLHYFISEKDEGMYHAINKGIAQATGDYILILNSDDYLYNSNTLSEISNQINQHQFDFFYCDIIRKKENVYRKIKLRKYSLTEVLCSEHCTFVPHPSFFISRKFIKQHQMSYDLKYKYASDFDYILKTMRHSSNNYKHLKIFSTVFRDHPNSITSSGKINNERIAILENWNVEKISVLKRLFLYYSNWIMYKIRTCEKYRQ